MLAVVVPSITRSLVTVSGIVPHPENVYPSCAVYSNEGTEDPYSTSVNVATISPFTL